MSPGASTEGTGPWYSNMNRLYGENRFYRHVASHWIEMQQAMIAQLIGGVFEFHPKLRVGYLEAQNSWVPGILTRIEWDYPNYKETHAPYLTMTPKEYFLRNCWAAVEGSEPEIEPTASLIGSEHMCMSTDYPHFDSNFPNVSNNLLNTVSGRRPRTSCTAALCSTTSPRQTSLRPMPQWPPSRPAARRRGLPLSGNLSIPPEVKKDPASLSEAGLLHFSM